MPRHPLSAPSVRPAPGARPVGRPGARTGYTLIELLIMITLVAVIGRVAMLRYGRVRATAGTALLQADLARYRGRQDIFRLKNGRYGTPAEIETGGWRPSGGAVVDSARATAYGWALSVRDPKSGTRCVASGASSARGATTGQCGTAVTVAMMGSPATTPPAATPVIDSSMLNAKRVIATTSGKCLRSQGGALSAGTLVELWDCDNTPAQRWTFPAAGTSGPVRLAGSTTLCLDDWGATGSNGDQLKVWTCTGGANQNWTVSGSTIRGLGGRCVDLDANRSANGTTVNYYTCNGLPQQSWNVTAWTSLYATGATPADSTAGASGVRLVAGSAFKCLRPQGGGASSSAALELWDCDTSLGQRWTLPATGTTGPIKITSSGLCLDVYGAGGTGDYRGNTVGTYSCHGGANQQFTVMANGEIHMNTGLCVEIENDRTANGSPIKVWPCYAGIQQKWQQVP